MRTPPTLLRDAVTHGLVAAGDVVAGRVVIRPVIGSNLVHRVDVDGSAVAYVKQAGAASVLDVDDTVAVETRALRRLIRTAPVPRVLLSSEDSLWTAPAAGVPLGLLDRTEPEIIDLAAAGLGRALAQLHWSVLDPTTPPARLPWPLHPSRLLPSMHGTVEGSACAEVLATLTTEPVRATLAAAAAWWRASTRGSAGTWVHGDLSAGNALVAGVGHDRPSRVTLIDLEAAGAGDPSWDVVCAEAALDATDPRPDAGCSVAIFRTAYAAAGGLGQSTAALRCVRELMTAWQYAAAQHRRAPRPDRADQTDHTDQTRAAVRALLLGSRTEAYAWQQEAA